MVTLSEIRDLVSSLFIMLNKKMYILFRIEFLVVLVTVLFLVMFIMDIFRRYMHSSVVKAIFSLLDAVSDSIVIYLLGAMQTAPFKNQLFPVWALVLVIFRYSVNFISGYGVPDRGGRRFAEWRNVVKLLGSAFLNWTRGSRFAAPLWSLWALQILRSWYRLHSHTLAIDSLWLGGSSELISEYMHHGDGGHDDLPGSWKPEECNPETMEGYKYLICGERVTLDKPRYVLVIKNSPATSNKMKHGDPESAQREDDTTTTKPTRTSLITLDKIWGCRRHLLCLSSDHNKSSHAIQGKDLKDHCLAFALSRLLRCRLEDVMLQGKFWFINQKLVKKRIIEEKDDKGAFRITELQLSFANDYFNTRYPMVFWSGLVSLFLSLLQSVLTIGVVCWLSIDIRRVYKPPHGELAHLVHGFNVDMCITWVFMLFVVFKEIWEMVTYLLSDWTRLLLVCMYAKRDGEKVVRNRCMERVILSFFTCKITAKRWHGHLDQYVFMESYDHRPTLWNLIHKATTGMVPRKDNGARLSSAIHVPDYVKPAIMEKLRALLEWSGSQGLTEPASSSANGNVEQSRNGDDRCLPLPRVIIALSEVERYRRYGWACYGLQTSSDIILVWHVATNLCEMALAKKHGIDLRKPGFLGTLVSCFTDYFSSKPYLIDMDAKKKEENKDTKFKQGHGLGAVLSLFTDCCSFKFKSNEKKDNYKFGEDLRKNYTIANSLSRYCAYLLVSKPDLIPDSFLLPKMVFQQAVKTARDVILKDCDSLESRHNKLIDKETGDSADQDSIKTSDEVVKQGALLANELIRHEGDEGCWEMLAEVWVELLIHIAPTWNAEAHKKCLESGGEFINNIWALLWHCGIDKSDLWPTDDVPEDNVPADPQDSDVGNNNINAEEMEQAGGTETRNHQIRIEVHEEGASEISGTQYPEARKSTRISEIEDVPAHNE